MKRIIPIKHEKIWGYEIWLNSPVVGKETSFEDGNLTKEGPLVKIIKANMPLSVQVHPDDNLAKELENQENGKSESWYILDAEKDAELVLGLNDYEEEAIRKQITNGLFEDNLIKQKISKNEFYNIPAGLIHGIGAGCLVFEIQQPSDVTYRYYDYNRLENGKPRELHIDKALRSQKNLDWNLKQDSEGYFDLGFCKQKYFNQLSKVKTNSIVVNLETYETFLTQKEEEINFNKYVVIEW